MTVKHKTLYIFIFCKILESIPYHVNTLFFYILILLFYNLSNRQINNNEKDGYSDFYYAEDIIGDTREDTGDNKSYNHDAERYPVHKPPIKEIMREAAKNQSVHSQFINVGQYFKLTPISCLKQSQADGVLDSKLEKKNCFFMMHHASFYCYFRSKKFE